MWTNSYFLTENNKEIDFSNKTVFVAMTNFLRMCKQDSVRSDPSESCSILKYLIEGWWSCNHCNNSKTVHNLKKPWIEIHVKWPNDKKLRTHGQEFLCGVWFVRTKARSANWTNTSIWFHVAHHMYLLKKANISLNKQIEPGKAVFVM